MPSLLNNELLNRNVYMCEAKKKIMSVSSDMFKNIRVGRPEKSFFLFIYFFLKKSWQNFFSN